MSKPAEATSRNRVLGEEETRTLGLGSLVRSVVRCNAMSS